MRTTRTNQFWYDLVAVAVSILGLALAASSIYIAIHFIRKYW